MAKVSSQSLAHVSRERQPIFPAGFASDDKLSSVPVDILQRHMNHFCGTQAEPGQEEQNGVIPPSCEGFRITNLQETFGLIRQQELG